MALAITVLGAANAGVGFSQGSGSAKAQSAAKKARWCGRVRSHGQKFRVRVNSGRIACRPARSVIRYVLNHGKVTQGSPERAPKGWSCSHGYGYWHGDANALGRSGPRCLRRVHRLVSVEGYAPGFTPKPR